MLRALDKFDIGGLHNCISFKYLPLFQMIDFFSFIDGICTVIIARKCPICKSCYVCNVFNQNFIQHAFSSVLIGPFPQITSIVSIMSIDRNSNNNELFCIHFFHKKKLLIVNRNYFHHPLKLASSDKQCSFVCHHELFLTNFPCWLIDYTTIGVAKDLERILGKNSIILNQNNLLHDIKIGKKLVKLSYQFYIVIMKNSSYTKISKTLSKTFAIFHNLI